MQHTTGDISPEKAVLIGVALPSHQRWMVEDNLMELRFLAATSGVEVVDQVVQERSHINPAYFIGKGKVEELSQLLKMYDAATVIFDDDLTPAQIRNLERATSAKIIDRSTLILDIFAQHARTRAAKTQVELAQLQHLLPRLTRQWTHLSRQVGGIGTKGPGETQLETDRRLIRKRIEALRSELERIDRQRDTRRKGRKREFRVSLIGYTNVGKSTLMNLLSGADVLVEDQLFATLDSTIRRVQLDADHHILLSDTVGFIRKLPHNLVESFKSTLDEVLDADLLLHVVDISHPVFEEQIKTVLEVLRELGASEKPILTVFNKIDLLKEKELIGSMRRQFPDSVFVSATRQIRTGKLKEALVKYVERNFVTQSIEIPIALSGLLNTIHSQAVVEHQEFLDETIQIRYRTTPAIREKITRLIKKASKDHEQLLANRSAS